MAKPSNPPNRRATVTNMLRQVTYGQEGPCRSAAACYLVDLLQKDGVAQDVRWIAEPDNGKKKSEAMTVVFVLDHVNFIATVNRNYEDG